MRKEGKTALDDRDWWTERAPPGFTLYGYTYRDYATFFRPNGKTWHVSVDELTDLNVAYGRVIYDALGRKGE